MPGILSRSKSLRMLRGNREPNQAPPDYAPRPALPQAFVPTADYEPEPARLKASMPVTRAGPRVETPDISQQRPRTSGGPADRAKAFHRKVAINSYNSSTTSLVYSSPNKSTTTILYAAEVHDDTTGVIGIALGSPTMNPHWNASPYGGKMGTVTHITAGAHADPPESSKEDQQEAPKPKLSRWKSIFGRRQPPGQKQPFYQVAQSVVPPRADSHHDDDSINSRATSRAEERYEEYRVETRQSRKAANRYELAQLDNGRRPRAATTTPNAPGKPRTVLMRSVSSPRLRMEGAKEETPSVPQLVLPTNTQSSSANLNGSGPLLDIDIPNIKLDRYSVMFGSLLQSGSNSAGDRSSSLLARRQGNVDRLKPLNELAVKEEDDECRARSPRRATSPSLPNSPTFSLYPTANASSITSVPPRSTSLPRVRPLQRSATAPATSPSQPNFPSHQSVDIPTEAQDTINTTFTSDPLTASPTSQLSFTSSISSTSASSEADADTPTAAPTTLASPSASISIPWKPTLTEPQWEMVSKPSPLTALRSHPTTAPAAKAPSSSSIISPLTSPSHTPSSSSLSSSSSESKLKSKRVEDAAADTPIVTCIPNARSDVLARARSTRHASPSEPSAASAYPRTGSGSVIPALVTSAQSTTTTSTAATARIGIARSVSVSRASPRSADVVRSATVARRRREMKDGSAAGTSLGTPTLKGRVVEREALTPVLVEVGGRRSQRGEVGEA